MPQPATKLDVPVGQTVRVGSQLINFTTAGNLIAEDIQFTKGTRNVDFPDDLGQDSRAAYSSVKGVGTMTVQLSTVSSTLQNGDSGNLVLSNGSTMPFFVTSASEVYQQNGAAKIQITFAEWMQFSPIPKKTIYDGGVGNSFAISPHRVKAHNVPGSNQQCFIVRQRFCQLKSSWVSSGLGAFGPVIEGQQTYLVDETEMEDTGVGGMITIEAVWASRPSQWQQTVSVAKNYQIASYTWTAPSGPLLAQGLAGYTQTIRAVATYDYYFDSASVGTLPTVPTLMLANLFGSQVLTDGGTGFPTQSYPFGTGFGNNYGTSFIAGSIEPYVGKMMVRKLIYG